MCRSGTDLDVGYLIVDKPSLLKNPLPKEAGFFYVPQVTFNLKDKLSQLKSDGLHRSLKTRFGAQNTVIEVHSKKLLNFSSNDYLGLASHPTLTQASIKATQEFGTGTGASRLITGSQQLHHELEEEIASFKRTEKALLFNSGYHANLGLIQALEPTVVFSDELNHASLIDGCKLSKAKILVYKHNDMNHLESLLKENPGGLIVTDTVFSMDGDVCPLHQIMQLAERYDATVFVDEAHATGVFGKTGRGVVEEAGIDPKHPQLIQMGTLGKALGSFGAYVAGSSDLIDWLINRARTFIFTTSLPPGVVAASLAAIRLIRNDTSLKDQLWKNTLFFAEGMKCFEGAQQRTTTSPIIPLMIGDANETMALSQSFFDQGIWAQGIRPPTVAEGSSRIRFTIMATHTQEQLQTCLNVVKHSLKSAR